MNVRFGRTAKEHHVLLICTVCLWNGCAQRPLPFLPFLSGRCRSEPRGGGGSGGRRLVEVLGGVILPRERRKYVGRGGWKAFVAPSWFSPGTPGLVVPFFRGFPNAAYSSLVCV